MSFDLEFGFVSLPGRKSENEDFAALVSGQGHEQARGAIAAIADGVSTGGFGREAAQTTVTTLVRDYFGTPETWDTTVALDRVISAQNAWLAGINRRRQPALGLTTLIDVAIFVIFTHPVMQLLARTRFFGGGHKLSGLDPEALGAVYRSRFTPSP